MAGRRKLEEIGSADGSLDADYLSAPAVIDAAYVRDALGPDSPGTPGLSDIELLRRHVAGDGEAFGKLFSRHKERLWAVALRTARDPEEAADALQEAMVSAFRRAGDFRGESAVTTWLHRIVVNAAVDRLRRTGRMLNWSGEQEALDTLAIGEIKGISVMDSTEIRIDVDTALRRLPAQQRIALVLVDMLGYPVAEAGEILGVSVGTVKSRCARGRARLLPILSHLRTNLPDGGNQPAAASVTSVALGSSR